MNFSPFSLNKLINDHGVTVTLKKRVAGAYNVTTGSVTNTETNYSVKAYEYNNVVDGLSKESLQLGVKRFCLKGTTVSNTSYPKPTTNDQLVSTKTGNIISVKEIKSGSSVMCYVLEVRD